MSTMNTEQHSPHSDDLQDWSLVALTPELGELAVTVGKSLSIGRSDSNDVVLASPQVSRQHAKLNRIGDKIYVQDLGSANGTFVNGERISTEAVGLQPLDELAFADLLFAVNYEDNSTQTIQALADETSLDKALINETLPQISPVPVTELQSSELTVANVVTDTLTSNDTVKPPTQSSDINGINAEQQTDKETVAVYKIDKNSKPTTIDTIDTEVSPTEATSDVVNNEMETATTVHQTPPTVATDNPVTSSTANSVTTPTEKTEKKGIPMIAIAIAILLLIIVVAMLLR